MSGPTAGDVKSRAGRNLPMAIGVGLGLGAVIVASLLLYRQLFVVIIIAAVVASVWELRTTLVESRGITLACSAPTSFWSRSPPK